MSRIYAWHEKGWAMRKTVTVCDQCKRMIRDGEVPLPFRRHRMLYEQRHDFKAPFYQIWLTSERFVDGAGESDHVHILLDLCQQCVESRLIPALERIVQHASANS